MFCYSPKPLDLATGLAQVNAQWGNRDKLKRTVNLSKYVDCM